jgi:LytS/YehU family sensor histidine kinase
MTLSRQVLYPLFDMGEYNPGNIVFRFLMEYHKQLFWYMIIYAIFFAINSFRESQKQRIKASELQEELSKAKIHFLQSQINPHFLFNTLNMISSIMYDNPKDADKMIANLSDMLRKTLHNNKETHSLKRELELLKLYTDIMNARFHDKLRIEIVTDSQSQSAEVPWFFLQPIFENSIKHSSDYTNVCQIRMNSYVDKNNLKIEIMDNGPGLKNESEKIQQTGVGLSNIISRLEKIYGNYKFNMSNNPGGGLKVEIVIPYRKIDE